MADNLSLKVTLGAVDHLTAPLQAALRASQFLNTEINQLKNNFRAIRGESSSASSALQSLGANEQATNAHINATNSALHVQLNTLQQLRNTPPPLIPNAYRQQFAANRERRSQLTQEAQGLMAIGKAFEAPLEEAQKYQTVTEKFNQYGMGQAALDDAKKFVAANRIAGASQVELMTYFTEAQGVFRESGAHTTEHQLEAAKMAAPMLAKINIASKGLDEHMQGLMHDQQMDMLRFTEQMGGLKSPERFNEIMGGGFKAIQSSGGNVDWSAYRQFASKAGSSAYQLNDKTLFAKLEPIIGEMKGGAAGDALMTSFSRLTGIVKNKVVSNKLLDMGIWDKNAVELDKLGQMKRIKNGMQPLKKVFSDLLATDPVKFYQDVIFPKYKEMGLSENQIMIENSQIFGRQGGKMFNLIHKQKGLIEKSVESFDKARELDASYEAIQKNYAGQKMALDAKWKNFELALGKDSGLLDLATKGLEKLGGVIEFVTGFAEKFPQVTNSILLLCVALAGLKVAMLVGGFAATFISDAILLSGLIFNFFTPSVMAANLAALRLSVTSRLLAVQTRLTSAAIWLWNAALTANPIGLIIIAVAALAFAVYKYWEPIKAFTMGLWDGLSTGLAPLAPLFEWIYGKAKVLFDYFAPAISGVIDWFTQLFSPIQSTKAELDGAANAGRNFGTSIATAITSAISFLSSLHEKCVGYGVMIMEGLVNGITTGYAIVKAKISEVAETVKTSFKDALGIHSPSKIFEEFGLNINAGLGIGLQQNQKPIAETINLAKSLAKTFTDENPGKALAGTASQAMAFFMKEGWTKDQAAGIAANLQKESGFKANAVGDNGKAYGIGQWHPDRQALFAKQFGHGIKGSSLEEQLKFVLYELGHNEKRAGDKLKATQSARDAGAIVSKFYERPAKTAAEAAERGASAARLATKGIDVAALSGLSESDSSSSGSALPTSTSGSGVTYNQSITINVHGAEGMSTMQLAAMVEQKFRERTSKSGQMFDGAY